MDGKEKKFTSSKLLEMLKIPARLPGVIYDALENSTDEVKIHIGLGALGPLVYIDYALNGIRRLVSKKNNTLTHSSQPNGWHNSSIESPVESSIEILFRFSDMQGDDKMSNRLREIKKRYFADR